MKKTILLTSMFMDVATASERKKFDAMYEKRNKGAATAFALRTIKLYWDLHIAKKGSSVKLQDNGTAQPQNTIRINSGGMSWFVERD